MWVGGLLPLFIIMNLILTIFMLILNIGDKDEEDKLNGYNDSHQEDEPKHFKEVWSQ